MGSRGRGRSASARPRPTRSASLADATGDSTACELVAPATTNGFVGPIKAAASAVKRPGSDAGRFDLHFRPDARLLPSDMAEHASCTNGATGSWSNGAPVNGNWGCARPSAAAGAIATAAESL